MSIKEKNSTFFPSQIIFLLLILLKVFLPLFMKKELFMLPLLSLNDVLFIPKFPISLLFISKFTTQKRSYAIFYLPIVCFKIYRLR